MVSSNSTHKVSKIDLNTTILFSFKNMQKEKKNQLCAQERSLITLVVNLDRYKRGYIPQHHNYKNTHTVNNTIYRITLKVG
jgi:hypothetical protein